MISEEQDWSGTDRKRKITLKTWWLDVGGSVAKCFGWRPATGLVLGSILAHISEKSPNPWVGRETLARHTGLSLEAVKRAFRELQASVFDGAPIMSMAGGEPTKPGRRRQVKLFPGLMRLYEEMIAQPNSDRDTWLTGRPKDELYMRKTVRKGPGGPPKAAASGGAKNETGKGPGGPPIGVQVEPPQGSRWTQDRGPGGTPRSPGSDPFRDQMSEQRERAAPCGAAAPLSEAHHDQEDQTAPSSGVETSGTGSEADRRVTYREAVLYPSEVQEAVSRCNFTATTLDAVLREGLATGITEARMAEMIVSAATKEKPYAWLRTLMRGAE